MYQGEKMTITYRIYGNHGEKIILLPGWGEVFTTLLPLIHELEKDYIVYVVDYPGFHHCPLPTKDLTIYDYAITILEWLEKENIENPILIGHSFGGRISILLSGYYHYPIEKIILMGAAGIKPIKTWKEKKRVFEYKLFKFIVTKFKRKKNQEKYLKVLRKIYGSSDYQELDQALRKTFVQVVNEDLRYYLKDVSSDVLLLWGELDTSTPIHDAYLMKEQIKNSTLKTWANAGHFCYMDNFDECVKEIKSFLLK